MKVQAHNSLALPWNTIRPRYLWQIKVRFDLFNRLWSYRNTIQFQISFRREKGKEIPKSSRLELLKQFLAKKFPLAEAEHSTWTMNRRGIADLLLLRTVLTICQKSRESRFWEVIVLLAYTSLTSSKTHLQRLLACLNFVLNSEDLFCWYKQKSDF